MAETLINTAIQHHGLENKPCVTKELSIYGNVNTSLCTSSHEYMYGSEILKVRNLISEHLDYQQKIHPRYHYKVGEVIWFARWYCTVNVVCLETSVLVVNFFAKFLTFSCRLEINSQHKNDSVCHLFYHSYLRW